MSKRKVEVTLKKMRTGGKQMHRLSLILAITIVLLSCTVEARDLGGRLGLGYNSEFSNGVPGISLKYGLTREIGIEGILGIVTSSPGRSVSAVKLSKNVFYETNLNFYFALGGGVLTANNITGAEFIGAFGAEFFIPGIESLGFAMETGANFSNISGSFVLSTLGVSFLNAGIHFYF